MPITAASAATGPSPRDGAGVGRPNGTGPNSTGPNDAAPAGDAKGGDAFGFFDLLDVFNPLQHIPVVSTIYRAVTGDEIGAPARIIGGALFTGPVGFMLSAVNSLVKEGTGRDFGGNLLALLTPAAPQTRAPADPASPDPVFNSETVTAGQPAAAPLVLTALESHGKEEDAEPAEDDPPPHAFVGAMLENLDKYEQLFRQRHPAPPRGSSLDLIH